MHVKNQRYERGIQKNVANCQKRERERQNHVQAPGPRAQRKGWAGKMALVFYAGLLAPSGFLLAWACMSSLALYKIKF